MAKNKVKLRPSVRDFAERMEKKLRENDYKGGWENCGYIYLVSRLKDETNEAENTHAGTFIPGEFLGRTRRPTDEDEADEWADVANFAMMLAEKAVNCKKKK